MPTSDASTSTMNWREGGRMSTVAEVNRLLRAENVSSASASGVKEKGRRVEVRAVSGAATR